MTACFIIARSKLWQVWGSNCHLISIRNIIRVAIIFANICIRYWILWFNNTCSTTILKSSFQIRNRLFYMTIACEILKISLKSLEEVGNEQHSKWVQEGKSNLNNYGKDLSQCKINKNEIILTRCQANILGISSNVKRW